MLEVVGFIVLWPIFWLVVGFAVNMLRAREGIDLRDGLSAFLQAMVLPPFAILGSFSPQARASGQSSGMFWGGVVGTALAIYIFLEII